ncbi:MAG: lysostaphin resistance A-like protein [Maritimibacter sp.]
MDFWTPALEKRQVWRTLLGAIIVSACFFGATFGVIFGGALLLETTPEAIIETSGPREMAVFFLTFLGIYVGLALVVPLLHRRRFMSLFGPTSRVDVRHFGFGILVTAGIATLLYLFQIGEQLVLPLEKRAGIDLLRPVGQWAIWLLPALVLILMQSLAEELFFRGYLLQQLRARFRGMIICAVIPSFLFGMLHFDFATFGWVNGGAYVLSTTLSGVMACFITLRTGNLGAVAGLHFGNNASLVFLGIQGQMDGFSLFGAVMAPQSGYTTYSMLLQTGLQVVAFFMWWRWMNKRNRLQTPPSSIR